MPFDERESSDPTWMRAMAHPLRWQILDVLRSSPEPMTATQVSEEVGESPANCSFHLRTLAKYGFIEEAGGGKGRSRPWRPRDVQIEISDESGPDAPAGARALRDVIRTRSFQAIEAWEHDEHSYPPAWREAAMSAEWELKLTIDDLAEIEAEFKAILDRYTSREKSPDGAVQAKVLAWAFPIGTPPEAAPSPTRRRRETYLRSSRTSRTGTNEDR
ncbi:transcriptional regulator [Microlunatus endophyticus]|uniref:Transcriptional regulator n=1 Tax=Microlunatus endophyticus TaxID=1716077 RepID=A0A917S303_9ACTN|nr:helix-turn-helix domain-containing protein [Microlunatus endophyticus]GGL53893.1 transcriptional regulator [Microlunatus endophyticus]